MPNGKCKGRLITNPLRTECYSCGENSCKLLKTERIRAIGLKMKLRCIKIFRESQRFRKVYQKRPLFNFISVKVFSVSLISFLRKCKIRAVFNFRLKKWDSGLTEEVSSNSQKNWNIMFRCLENL